MWIENFKFFIILNSIVNPESIFILKYLNMLSKNGKH